MRHRAIGFFLILAGVLLPAGAGPASASLEVDDKDFREIKLMVFDEQWTEALARLDAFIAGRPDDPQTVPALYYRAKCLEEIGGRSEAALKAYREYLRRGDRNRSLGADAEASIIDLAVDLYEHGDRTYLPEVEERLTHPDKELRYYAAIRLSYLKDKKAAVKSVPILKTMLAEESNPELLDRAKIALLRVEPKALAEESARDGESERSDQKAIRRARMFHIQIVNFRTKDVALSLNLPFGLADLALSGMDASQRGLLKERGYDIDKILKELKEGGDILEIKDEKEGISIRIWID